MKFENPFGEDDLIEPWSNLTKAIVFSIMLWASVLLILFCSSCSMTMHPDGSESFDLNGVQAIQAVEELNRINNQK